MYGVATEWEQHRILRSAVMEVILYWRLGETRHGEKISHTIFQNDKKIKES